MKNILIAIMGIILTIVFLFSLSNNRTLIIEKKSLSKIEELKLNINKLEKEEIEINKKVSLAKSELDHQASQIAILNLEQQKVKGITLNLNKEVHDKNEKLQVISKMTLENENKYRKLSSEISQMENKKNNLILELNLIQENLEEVRRMKDTNLETKKETIKETKVENEKVRLGIKTIQEIR